VTTIRYPRETAAARERAEAGERAATS